MMFARIDGGPLHAKHHAAVVIQPVHKSQPRIREGIRSTNLVKVPRNEEQPVRSWLTNDIERQPLDLCDTVRTSSPYARGAFT